MSDALHDMPLKPQKPHVGPRLWMARLRTELRPSARWRTWLEDGIGIGGAIFPWDVGALASEGCRAVLSLCSEFGDPERALERHDIRCHRIGIPDHFAPSMSQLEEALDWIGRRRRDGHPVYVHCALGSGRSGTVVAAWFMKSRGLAPDEAVAMAKTGRPQVHLSPMQKQRLEEWWGRCSEAKK